MLDTHKKKLALLFTSVTLAQISRHLRLESHIVAELFPLA